MQNLYNEILTKSYNSCKRLEYIVDGVIKKLENEDYQREAPMSKQLALASRASSVLASITELSQILKSEGAELVETEPVEADPRIPTLIEKIRRLQKTE